MKTYIFAGCAILLVALMTTSCSNEEKGNAPPVAERITLSRAESLQTREYNRFAIELIKNTAAHNRGNFVISPLCVEMNLAMLANGAGGHT